MIRDKRVGGDEKQLDPLIKRLEKDGVTGALEETNKFLGKYSSDNKFSEFSIILTGGNVGNGQYTGSNSIEVQMPSQDRVITQMRPFVKMIQGMTNEEIDDKSQELALILTTSTILHECVHLLVNSKPGSSLANDFERVSRLSNEGGKKSTLLDEGLAYAIQGIFTAKDTSFGDLTPRNKDGETPEVSLRKSLGGKLRPKVVEYMKNGKPIDDAFLRFAAGCDEIKL